MNRLNYRTEIGLESYIKLNIGLHALEKLTCVRLIADRELQKTEQEECDPSVDEHCPILRSIHKKFHIIVLSYHIVSLA